ncbi:MAG: hypothetical protein PHY09_10170 [Desulfuromonadaceae bacterium]|nr:hypothetical protein [Desulfuromonadaceae bacterium]
MARTFVHLTVFFIVALVCGCGSGGAPESGMHGALSRATISFSLVSTARLPFRINGVQLIAPLPSALDVTTADNGLISGGLTPGSAVAAVVSGPSLLFGTYSANMLSIVITDGSTAQTGFGPGEMARMTWVMRAGAVIGESDRLALEKSVTFKASGWDQTVVSNPSSLDGYLRPKIVIELSE